MMVGWVGICGKGGIKDFSCAWSKQTTRQIGGGWSAPSRLDCAAAEERSSGSVSVVGLPAKSFLQATGAARLARKCNHGYPRLERMIPASWDWQKKSKNRSSLLAQFLFLPCPIRTANTPLPSQSPPCSLCPLWLNKML